MKNILNFPRNHPYIVSLVILLVAGGFGFQYYRASTSTLGDTITVHPVNFQQTLAVSGTVVSAQAVDLGFAQSGRIAGTYAKVGDSVRAGEVLAKTDSSSLQATLLQKQAVLDGAEAQLSSLEQGTRPEQLAVSQQQYENAAAALLSAMTSSEVQVEDAIVNKTDAIFNDGNGINPTINVNAGGYDQQQAIDQQRLVVGEKIKAWKEALAAAAASSSPSSDSSLSSLRIVAADTLGYAKTFLGALGAITVNLTKGSSGLSQSVIDADQTSVNAAGLEVSQAASSEQVAEASLASAEKNLSLDQAGSTQQQISAQEAQVEAAKADLQNVQAQISQTIVTAPFDGVVTKMDAKVGEIVTSNTSDISMISSGVFQIQSYVPEVYIASLKVGNLATTTLDAYGPSTYFNAKVIQIDPAETVVNGVSNYKTTLQFLSADSRIRSGMTASLTISTADTPNAFVVPQGAILNKLGHLFVQVKKGKVAATVPIVEGSTSSIGDVQILSGLSDGDQVLLNPTAN